MAGVGLVMILLNVFDYLFGWERVHPAVGTIGLVLVVIGFKTARKSSGVSG